MCYILELMALWHSCLRMYVQVSDAFILDPCLYWRGNSLFSLGSWSFSYFLLFNLSKVKFLVRGTFFINFLRLIFPKRGLKLFGVIFMSNGFNVFFFKLWLWRVYKCQKIPSLWLIFKEINIINILNELFDIFFPNSLLKPLKRCFYFM